jgi:hypothetical protein
VTRRLLLCGLLAIGVAVPAAFAAPVHPAGLPFRLTLPAGWTPTGASGVSRFSAAGPSGAQLAVTKGGSFPMSLPFATFVSIETASAKKAYRAEDSHAVVTARRVRLPSGPAVRISVTVNHGGAAIAIDLYSLLHKGVTYHFTYFTSRSQLASAADGFNRSARSIHWTS